jgi:23S rRNA (guanosine2251-2'-O)-methyltransferase
VAEGTERQRLSELRNLATRQGIQVEVKPASHLRAIARTPTHQGIVAFLPPFTPLTIEQLIARLGAHSPIPPIAVLDGVKDPRNLGALIRCAAVFGVGGVVLREWRAVGLTATVAKTAAGGLEHVAVAEVGNLSHTLKRLKERGFWVIGADEQGDVACDTVTFPSPLALVFGDEGKGLSPLVKRHCDVLVRIPVTGPLRSLNVAVAAGVLFYVVTSQPPR